MVGPTRALPLAWALLAALAAAQADAQPLRELLGRPIARVRYDPPVPGRNAEEDTGLRAGVRVDRAFLRGAVERLWKSRRFSRVRVLLEAADAHAVEVLVETRPLVRVESLAVLGADALEASEVVRFAGYRQDDEIWPEDLPEVEAAIERGYAERGYRAARASAHLRPGEERDRAVLEVAVREGRPLHISQVRLRGPIGLPAWRVRDALDVDRGDVHDFVRLRAGLERATALYREHGYFLAAFGEPIEEPTNDGVRLVLPIDAGDRHELTFAGNRWLSARVLRDAMALDDERLLDAAAIEEVRRRLARFYRLHGFLNAEVSVSSRVHLRRKPRERVRVVTFHMNEGVQLQVVSLRFPGAMHFTPAFLREQVWSYLEEEVPGPALLEPVDVGALDGIGVSGGVSGDLPRDRPPVPLRVDPRRVFEPDVYARAIDHIQELYKADGYLGIEVAPAVVGQHGRELHVRVEVDEGVRTLVSEVTFEGNRTIASRELHDVAAIYRGTPLSYAALEEASRRLLTRLQEAGLYYAAVHPEIDISETKERARVRYVVDEGPPVRVARIEIRGNQRTSGALIRERLALETGDPLRPSAARRSEERLAALGVFQGVTVEPEAKDVPEADKTLVVTVVERLPQYMELHGGFSTGQGARGGFEYRYRNLFGYALSLHARAEVGYQVFFLDPEAQENFQRIALVKQLERRLSLGFTLPHTPPVGDLTTGFHVAAIRENERDFGYDRQSAILSFTTSALRRLTPSLDLGIEENDVAFFRGVELAAYLRQNPRFRRVLRVPQGRSAISLVRPSVSYDRRDNPFSPTQGWFASVGSEYVRTLDVGQADFQSQFVKVSTLLSGYVPLGRRFVLALSGRYGQIFHLDAGSRTYPDRRFYLGGFDTVRGFLDESMIPEDLAREALADPTLARLAVPGGDAFVTARGELRFPIVLGFQGGVFFDAGNLWSNPNNLFERLVLRTSAGFGIRYATPVGPLALDWGFNLHPREHLDEGIGALHFSIGVF